MKIFAPDYYKNFKCIADRCKHNCCIGWEIDIDEDTFAYYKSIKGDFGEKLMCRIAADAEPAHFILSRDYRCPFLNENNLCDVIVNLGENGLCQICNDHPRFRNFFSDREEIGVGLCCEAACRLVLTNRNKVKIIETDDDSNGEFEDSFEKEFFEFRDNIIELLQDREREIDERISDVIEKCGIEFPKKCLSEWAEIYRKLERLDPLWDKKLDVLSKTDEINIKHDKKWDIAFEQLLVYFIYRHTAEGVYDGRLKERISFALLSYYVIFGIWTGEEINCVDELLDIARMYSAEIEYSEENLQTIYNVLGEKNSI